MNDDVSGPADAPARILVIDDEEIIHHSLRKILGRKGHEVETVLSAAEGLDRMYTQPYDLVITDLMMPEMNGIGLLEQMKKDAIELPVLMITGYPTISTAVKALRLGAVDYLAKPFTRQELLAPVSRALRRSTSPAAKTLLDTTTTVEIVPAGDVGIEAPSVNLVPGDTHYLREHSWACFRQDGAMDLGIEASFLETVGAIEEIETPKDGDLVEQGYAGIKLTNERREVHSVFIPVSGQVVEVNSEVIEAPRRITNETWIVRVIPTRLETEIGLLRRRRTDR